MTDERAVPTISVVMPVHNAAAYLARAVEGILGQTFADFEMICVDDGSTDESPSILAAYDDARLRVVTQANAGVIGALNAGLERARGRYVARMDADDLSLPQRFRRQVEFLDAHPGIAVLGTFATRIDAVGAPGEVIRTPVGPANIARCLAVRCPMIHPTVMFRREVYEALGPYPDAAHVEDYLYWMRASRRFDLANLPEPLLQYRVHGAGVSERRRSEQMANHRMIRREFWNERPPESGDRSCWRREHKRLVEEELAGLETATLREAALDDLHAARAAEVSLADGALRPDVGARCVFELSLLGRRPAWKWLDPACRAVGFRAAWATVRALLPGRFRAESHDPVLRW